MIEKAVYSTCGSSTVAEAKKDAQIRLYIDYKTTTNV